MRSLTHRNEHQRHHRWAPLFGLALVAGCGDTADEWPASPYVPPTSTAVCGGHGTRFAGGGNCQCNEGYDLDPRDITNCLPDAQTCGGHGDTSLDFDMEWTCACDTGYKVDPSNRLNCVATGGGGGGGGGGDTATCADRDIAYGVGGSSSTNCTFSWAACSNSSSYDLACNVYYISGMRIVECKCLRQGVEQGEAFYPDSNICLIESWPTIEGITAEECGWTLSGGGGGGGTCPAGTCTAITGGSVCLENGGIPVASPACNPITFDGCPANTVPVTYTDAGGNAGCACLYGC